MMLLQLNEKQKRLFLASEALSYGRGGIAEVIRITGFSRNTIKRGINELESGVKHDGKVRKIGGGPKYAEENYPSIEDEIRKLIDGSTYGNPERVLSYTTKSLRKIESELKANRIYVSHETMNLPALQATLDPQFYLADSIILITVENSGREIWQKGKVSIWRKNSPIWILIQSV